MDRLNAIVAELAVQVDNLAAFRVAAAQAARQIKPEGIEALAGRFHDPPPAPAGFGIEELGLGGWLAAWQAAIFEVFYHFGERSLPVLRSVAFGEYDWTQANAIEVLCRLAANGVQRSRILAEVQDAFPGLRYEAQLYTVRALLAQIEESASLAKVVEELKSVDDFAETVAEILEESDADRDNLADEELHGTVLAIEILDEHKWNQHVIAALRVDGVKNYFLEASNGLARVAVTDKTRLQKHVDGALAAAKLEDFAINCRIAIGFFSLTEQSVPVTIYPQSVTLLDG